MNVLFVSEYYPPKIMGGGEINLSLLANSLAAKGLTVSVLTSFHKGLNRYEMKKGVHIYRRLKTGARADGIIDNLKRSLLFPQSVEREVKRLNQEIKFDLVHFIGTSVIAAAGLKQIRKPFCATIESYPSLCPKGDRIYFGKRECRFICSFSRFIGCQASSTEIGKMKNKWYLKYNPLFLMFVYQYCRRLNCALKECNLIAISEYVKKVLRQHGLSSMVVGNAINVGKFRPDKKKERGNKPKVIYLGSITKFKGPQILLNAVRGIDCRCDLYGEGEMKEELQGMIDRFCLDAEIHPPVPYEKVPCLYAGSDIVVFPSIWPEPFGRIAIEAIAAGKPVIGSAIGGIKETIAASSGILVAPGNVEELRKAIIAANEVAHKDGGKYVEQRYGEQVITKKIIGFYEKILNSG